MTVLERPNAYDVRQDVGSCFQDVLRLDILRLGLLASQLALIHLRDQRLDIIILVLFNIVRLGQAGILRWKYHGGGVFELLILSHDDGLKC